MVQVLCVQGVDKWFGSQPGILSANLTLRAGSICGLIGANGAGKTTLLNVIAAQSPPTRGKVLLEGRSVWANPTEAKRRMGFVPDDEDLPEYLTGREYLEFVAAVRELDADEKEIRISHWLSYFGLNGAADRLVRGYSHGMKKKLQLAAGLLHEPALLVVDEPTNGLDPLSVRNLRGVLSERAARGGSILLATHDLAFAQKVCHMLCIVARNRILTSGTLNELLMQEQLSDLEEVYARVAGGP